MTPSTFTIGTIRSSYLSLNYLASVKFDSKKFINPSTTKEAGVSPGCCLAII
jgi:hypothetical protein